MLDFNYIVTITNYESPISKLWSVMVSSIIITCFGRWLLHHYTVIVIGKMSQKCELDYYLFGEMMTCLINFNNCPWNLNLFEKLEEKPKKNHKTKNPRKKQQSAHVKNRSVFFSLKKQFCCKFLDAIVFKRPKYHYLKEMAFQVPAGPAIESAFLPLWPIWWKR